MKKFKLLRDLPGAKAWDIIVYKDWDVYFEKCSDNTTPSFQTVDEHLLWMLEKMIREVEYEWWLEEIQESPKSIYELKDRGTYFYINDRWEIIDVDWLLWSGFEGRLEIWNVFFTEEEVEKELRKRKALVRIKRWIWKNKVKTEGLWDLWYKIFILWNSGLFVDKYANSQAWIWDIIFWSKRDAQRCLVECKKDWEILFNLKE